MAEIADAIAAHRPPPHDYEDPYQTLRPEDVLSSWSIASDFFRKVPPCTLPVDGFHILLTLS